MNSEITQRNTSAKVPWPVVTSETVEMSQVEGPRIKVRATQMFYYEHLRRREGDVFYLSPKYVTQVDKVSTLPLQKDGKPVMKLYTAEDQFDPNIMERVEDEEPERVTTAQQALNKAQDELNDKGQMSRKR